MSGKRAIIIDDHELMRKLVTQLLTKLGHEVLGSAENGRTGVALFKAEKPDFVMCDMQMPVMNGLDALKGILRVDAAAHVFMLTSVDDISAAESCMMIGAKDYISKGLPPEEMLAKIDDAINTHCPA